MLNLRTILHFGALVYAPLAVADPTLAGHHSVSTRQSNLDSCLSGSGVTTLTSSDAGYSQASLSFNRRFSYAPTALVYPTSSSDVQTIMKCVSGSGIPVVARSGGHSYAAYGLGGQNGSLVVDLSKMKTLSLDNSTGLVVAGTGNLIGEIALGIWDQGQRALPHGTCPYVGIGGHASYGGFGLFSRSAGLLLDRIVSADVVLANGTLVTATNSSNTDLFWALRGAAPSFGIVTSWTFSTLPAPPVTINWQITYPSAIPKADLLNIFVAYQAFGFSNPSNDLSLLLYLTTDNAGSLQMSISGSYYGQEADFTNIITPFKSTLPGNPTLVSKSYGWIDGLVAVDGSLNTTNPDIHDTFFAKSIFANQPFSNDSWTSWINYMTGGGSSAGLNWFAQIDLYAGAIAAVSDDSSSYAHRDSVFNFQFYGSGPASFPDSGVTFMNGLVSSLTTSPYAAYPNYIDPTLTSDQWQSLYFGDHYQRLTVIKRDVDPNNVFSFPQSIGVAGANVTASSGTTSQTHSKGSAISTVSYPPFSLVVIVLVTVLATIL